jgi:membrane protein YdbS with pleckstrin-like domain
MKCPQCGNDVVQGAAFCHVCGGSLAFKGQTAAAAPAPAIPATASPPRARLRPPGAPPDDHEQLLWEGRFSKLAMIGSWISAGAVTIALLIAAWIFNFDGIWWTVTLSVIAVMWVFLGLKLLYLQLSIKYSLTNQRFVHERGLLWRQTDRIETIDIDDVSVQQGPVERMLGIGTVRVVSSDQSTPQFSVVGIEDVKKVATMIDDARRQERRKRGLHIETV